jgi:putative lipase involved disintegration of autophagic bodies
LSVLKYYRHWLQVHRGFYTAYHNTTIRPAILGAVERAKKFYGDIQIIVTGHSMGGAMAAFCALDLTVTTLTAC